MRKRRWIWIAPLAIVGMLLFITLGGVLVLQLWNWLLPSLFGWPQITFWQALGVLVLCRILFGRFGGPGFGRGRMPRRIAERWAAMSPEEREQLRQGLRGHCGQRPSTSETQAQ